MVPSQDFSRSEECRLTVFPILMNFRSLKLIAASNSYASVEINSPSDCPDRTNVPGLIFEVFTIPVNGALIVCFAKRVSKLLIL